MASPTSKLNATPPKNVLFKPLTADFKALFKALTKGISHAAIGKWEELGNDAVETLSAIGIATEPSELAYLLVRRSITKALFDLVGECTGSLVAADEAAAKENEERLYQNVESSLPSSDLSIDDKFFDRPESLRVVGEVRELLRQWIEIYGANKAAAKAISGRFPGYFIHALNQEWRRNAKSYAPLLEAIHTPFTKAGDREWAWAAYSALLQRRIQEGIFDEPFSLDQIFIPLNAYFPENPVRKAAMEERGDRRRIRRIVVSLQEELDQWLAKADSRDTIRVISGGPGSGKSSFARVFAARIARSPQLRVLFVPLHLIDPAKDLVDEIGRFVRDEGVLLQNPLDPDSPEPNLLIIFDGLDELASQGRAATETARAFLREVEKTVEKRNLQSIKLRVLISGRELVVQENESEFRGERQILNLLPYFVPPQNPEHDSRKDKDQEEYVDSGKLLDNDLRHKWWKTFGALSGKTYEGLPQALQRPDLDEITAQPLLNYLVALSFTREKLDFTKNVNLNEIYEDLVAAVHARAYEKGRTFGPIRHMKPDEFARVLEEVGLAAWHGDGRTTTVREIEEHCRTSGLNKLLDVFQDGARAGVTRLLAAFFFRQYGQRQSGDHTFVFTHKSFGEYLTARRIVRGIDKVIRELEKRTENPDEGWDERDALKHWAQLCGPSAVSKYLHNFLSNEIALRDRSQLLKYQVILAKLFTYMLRNGLPMEQLQIGLFKESLFQARNAEEALLVALNACATVTQEISEIDVPDLFGAWFKRIQGQRTGPESAVAAACLSFLRLDNTYLDIGDFYGAELQNTQLRMLSANGTNFQHADLSQANLRGAVLYRANLIEADLSRSNLSQSYLNGANLSGANLSGADLSEADFTGSNLEGAIFDPIAMKLAKGYKSPKKTKKK